MFPRRPHQGAGDRMRPPSSPGSDCQRSDATDHAGNLVAEPLERPEQRYQLRRTALLPETHQPRPACLEPGLGGGVEEPLHHALIDEIVREPTVLRLHVERAVELVHLEPDVVQTEPIGDPREEVLAIDRDRRAGRLDLRYRARETVVGLGPAPLRVRGLLRTSSRTPSRVCPATCPT